MSRQRAIQFPLSPAAKEILGAALGHAMDGRPVFPCRPTDKAPFTAHGFKDATTDLSVIERLWRQFPGALIGMPTGPASSLWVLDLDVDTGKGINGIATFAELENQHTRLPATLSSRTPRGGVHHYWQWQEGIGLRGKADALGRGIDTRADGNYVVLPPSVRHDGVAYAWSSASLAAAVPAPDWLLELVLKGGKNGGYSTKKSANVSKWRELARGVSEGARNDSAARLAGYLLRHLVDPVVTLELLQCWNESRCSPPLPANEIARILDSICTRELRRRRSHG
jgi:Bifunctional DNA primase/polymerase, N-terminal/Primase C terminal 1 (PriCT-1)